MTPRMSPEALFELATSLGESLQAARSMLHDQAVDVLRLAQLVDPADALEAQIVAGIVQRARIVVGPAEKH